MPSIVLGSPGWLIPAVALVAIGVAAIAWSYARWRGPRWLAAASVALKLIGLVALTLCLVEPMLTGTRPQPGANIFVVLADGSQSFKVRHGDSEQTDADWATELLTDNPEWKTRLGQDFDVRNFVFDTHLRGVDGFDGLTFDGTASSLHSALAAVAKRYENRPLAGILVVSDGNATDVDDLDWSKLPPVFPLLPPDRAPGRDIAVRRATVNQTNFEAAPVTIQAEVAAVGYPGQPVVAVVTDETGKELERQTAAAAGADDTLSFRFQIRPERSGVGFFRVHARLQSEWGGDADATSEQTLANNARLTVVDRGGGPYRVLYVCGRPNWDYKFLRRSVEADTEVQLVGMVRIAKREPKFDFRAQRAPDPNNPLFKGFEHPDAETAERRDQPVLIRMGTEDAAELRGGFPQTAADLYRYHAVILDDLEAEFFTPDQQLLLRNFVARRGGGLLMMGGVDSFATGKYDRTPVGEVLPVYLDGRGRPPFGEYRLALTREGWLQPWVRTRKTEAEETTRLSGTAPFQTVNEVSRAKPGATVLAQVTDPSGGLAPALVAQPFGAGRSAALLIADLWRWGLRRETPSNDDFERAWRQTVRWLVADVPTRVQVRASPSPGESTPTIGLTVQAADPEYRPLDNASVRVRVTRPNGEPLTLTADPDDREAGLYRTTYVPRDPGCYRAEVRVTAADGSDVGRREVGWCVQPEADEFARLTPDRDRLTAIAARTGGEPIPADKLAEFVAGLPARSAPVVETWVSPLWHRGWYFLVAVGCLVAEWGLRRKYGLA